MISTAVDAKSLISVLVAVSVTVPPLVVVAWRAELEELPDGNSLSSVSTAGEIWAFPKIGVYIPKSSHFNGGFPYKTIHFGGISQFSETPIKKTSGISDTKKNSLTSIICSILRDDCCVYIGNGKAP